jgi:hypothetical protein
LVQPSALVALHEVQVAPAEPHALAEGTVQVPFAQQPLAQVVTSQPVHLPPVQWEPAVEEQFWQVTPPRPQERSISLVWQVPETSQQPLGQLVASQRQLPPWQCWPVAQAGLVPQPQPPSVRHESVLLAGQAAQVVPFAPHAAAFRPLQTPPSEQQPEVHETGSQMQAPLAQRCPAVHAGLLPQPQVPPTQLSLVIGSHTWQTTPPVPH